MFVSFLVFFFFSSRRRHTRLTCDWSSDVCSSDLDQPLGVVLEPRRAEVERLRPPIGADLATVQSLRREQRVRDGDRCRRRSEEHTSNSSHMSISYAVFCLKKKKRKQKTNAL